MGVSTITKTLLSAYKDIEEQCKIIDGVMLNYAVGSSKRNVFTATEKMFAYTNEKIALINAKVLVDETLGKMQRKASLIDVYIEKRRIVSHNTLEIAEKQIEEFNSLLLEQYKPAKIYFMISDSKFLMKIYKEYSKQELKRH